MVFSIPSFTPEERKQWKEGENDTHKQIMYNQWFNEMLREGSVHYDLPTSIPYFVGLTPKKMEIVKAKALTRGQVTIKNPFYIDMEEDDDQGPINIVEDAKEVVEWAEKNTVKAGKLYSRVRGSYFYNKFTFFRRMHFWMEKTVEKIHEYEQAKKKAKDCSYWNLDEDSRFSFREFVENPMDFTQEQFDMHLKSAQELDLIDRMQSSDHDQNQSSNEEYSSNEDDEDETD